MNPLKRSGAAAFFTSSAAKIACASSIARGDAAATVFDVDIQASDIIVRSHRTICYENGTVYEGFVDVTKGLADGEGRVTWGASAGRSNRKTYTGQFTAGRTAVARR